MNVRLTTLLGALFAILMVVAGMWAWNSARAVGFGTSRPEVTLWAMRSAGIALGAGAQIIFLTFVVGVVYRRDLFSDLLRMVAGLVAAVALVSAIALGLAGR